MPVQFEFEYDKAPKHLLCREIERRAASEG